MKRWIAPLAFVLLAACQGPGPRGPESPYYTYPGTKRISLEQTLTIPAGSATVRLQFGQPVASNAVQDSEPYCIFELASVRDLPQSVSPDHFAVARVERRIQDFAGMPVAPTVGMLGLFGRGNGPSQVYYVTEFRLNSDRNSLVRGLSCQSNQISYPLQQQRHLTLSEMQGALGAYFSFDLSH